MKNFTREELKALNFSEEQIEVVLSQQSVTDVKVVSDIEEKPAVRLNESNITPISDIRKYASGTVVSLPGFDGEHPFVAKLCRPSLLVMVKSGKIPNSLINQATQLFQKGASSLGKDNTVSDMYDIMESVCEAAMVQPKYEELKEAGINLTDEQMMAIFSYTQQGVKALEQFR